MGHQWGCQVCALKRTPQTIEVGRPRSTASAPRRGFHRSRRQKSPARPRDAPRINLAAVIGRYHPQVSSKSAHAHVVRGVLALILWSVASPANAQIVVVNPSPAFDSRRISLVSVERQPVGPIHAAVAAAAARGAGLQRARRGTGNFSCADRMLIGLGAGAGVGVGLGLAVRNSFDEPTAGFVAMTTVFGLLGLVIGYKSCP